MKSKFLFPKKFKLIGLLITLPSIIGFISFNSEPDIFDLTVFAIYGNNTIGRDAEWFMLINNNVFYELIGVLLIIGSILLGFSEEKDEDELVSKLRLDSLVWAVYVNYGILILLIMFIYGLPFFMIMLFNMFTTLWFFIIRFNFKLWQLRKEVRDEK